MPRYLNSQKYDECQLVVLINALIFYGKPAVSPDSIEYERLVDLIDARKDAPQFIEKAFDYLKLKSVPSALTLASIKKHLDERIPVGLTIRDETYHYHCVLVVDYKLENGETYLKVPNWKLETKNLWVSWERMKRYIPVGHSIEFGTVDKKRPRKLLYAILAG